MNNNLNYKEDLAKNNKLILEKRKRYQIYMILDQFISNISIFDFCSKDVMMILNQANILANKLNNKNITVDLIIVAFLQTNKKINLILKEFKLNVDLISETILSKQEEIKNKTIIENLPYNLKSFQLLENASENAIKRFKTPVISSEILFISLIEHEEDTLRKLFNNIFEKDVNWYLLRYRLIKELHNQEASIRSDVKKNQQFFTYLLKIYLQENEYQSLIQKNLLMSASLLFRNFLIKDLLNMNIFDILDKEINLTLKNENQRTYS